MPSSAWKIKRPPRSIISNTKECAGPARCPSPGRARVGAVRAPQLVPGSGVLATKIRGGRRSQPRARGSATTIGRSRDRPRGGAVRAPDRRPSCRCRREERRAGEVDEGVGLARRPAGRRRGEGLPAAVPSVSHGSTPSNVMAEKKRRPSATAGSLGSDGNQRSTTVVLMSRTRCAGGDPGAGDGRGQQARERGVAQGPFSLTDRERSSSARRRGQQHVEGEARRGIEADELAREAAVAPRRGRS